MLLANIFGPDLGIVVLIILAVLIFGSQAPKIARNLGTAGKEFRKAQAEAEQDAEKERLAKAAAAAAPLPVQPIAAAPSVVAAPSAEDKVTLTKSELDALLAAREAQAKQEASGSAS